MKSAISCARRYRAVGGHQPDGAGLCDFRHSAARAGRSARCHGDRALQGDRDDPGSSHSEDGKVAMVENTVDSTTGMVTVRGIMDNASETLWPGILVNTKLIVRIEDAVTVPSAAVQRSQTATTYSLCRTARPTSAGKCQPYLSGPVRYRKGLVRRRRRHHRRPIAVVGGHSGRAARPQGGGMIR